MIMKYYEVVGRDLNGDWYTIYSPIKTKRNAIRIAQEEDSCLWEVIDINLIIDDDLKETYDKYGKVR